MTEPGPADALTGTAPTTGTSAQRVTSMLAIMPRSSDSMFVPVYVIHQEINASVELKTAWAVVRSGVEPVVVNLPKLDPYIEHAAIEQASVR
ncbi:hypothetical protein E1267_33870 [Nonomuraea longispora]|uniref:Uncharacterized protein n=1 Tax=Nonomuraea longispora TaxID=1848320 RepID=A0A4R4MWY1_9ACTN|nr:hypothetical protein [Nonomuraea longispora]TDC00728.1 hypothetical protein E1267_33870 [Nonomuraea longispora]